jgi:hypothetical protein
MLRYICSLPNPGVTGNVRQLFYPDDDAGHARAEAWAQRENRPGRGVYDCIGMFANGTRVRRKETVIALDRIICDLDLKNIVQTREEIIAQLKRLSLPPTEIRDSGFGLHAIWLLKEPVDDEASMAQAEDFMRQMGELLAGDPAPTHRAALLRRPGTSNTKEEGSPRLCRVIEGGFHEML